MKYYIREWSDHSASLIAEDGYALDVYESLDDAINACVFDCMVEPEYIESHASYLAVSPNDFEGSFIVPGS